MPRVMDDLGYHQLCSWLEEENRALRAQLDRSYEQQQRVIQAFLHQRKVEGAATPSAPVFRKRHGNLIEAVRRVAHRLGRAFSLSDIEESLWAEQPLLMAQSSRKSISTALRRLYEAQQLVLVEEGRGTKPARYAPIATVFN